MVRVAPEGRGVSKAQRWHPEDHQVPSTAPVESCPSDALHDRHQSNLPGP